MGGLGVPTAGGLAGVTGAVTDAVVVDELVAEVVDAADDRVLWLVEGRLQNNMS